MKNIKIKLISAFLFVLGGIINAQTPITIQTAIETALKNNSSLKSERLKADYQQQLIKSAINLPSTNIVGDYGQINSFYNDSRIGIAQAFSFPTVYSRQKKLLKEEWQTATLNVNLREAELKQAVSTRFYTLIYLDEKEKLLQKSDTLYLEFQKKSNLRFQKGENNILEKTTAETQRGNILLQLIQLQQEKELVKSQFQLLLNSDVNFIPKSETLKLTLDSTIDSSLVAQHPNLKVLEQQKRVSLASTKLEKSKLLPNFLLGYNNTSITGTGANDVVYDKATRFQSGQIGIGIPLFGGSQKAKIAASKIGESISENEYQRTQMALQMQFQNALSQYQSDLEKLNYFEKTALPNAQIIIETANKQFYNGAINYLDWVLLINQSSAIKSNYIDTLIHYNEIIIQINFLTSKQ